MAKVTWEFYHHELGWVAYKREVSDGLEAVYEKPDGDPKVFVRREGKEDYIVDTAALIHTWCDSGLQLRVRRSLAGGAPIFQTSSENVGVGMVLSASAPLTVLQAVPGGGAEAVGVREGDILQAVDGEPVTAYPQAAKHIVGPAGSQVLLSFARGREQLDLVATRVKVGSYTPGQELRVQPTSLAQAADPQQEFWPLEQGVPCEIGIDFIPFGTHGEWQVAGVQPGSPAALSGQVFGGDVLLQVDNVDLRSRPVRLEELRKLIYGPPGSSVMLVFKRHGHQLPPITLTRRMRH